MRSEKSLKMLRNKQRELAQKKKLRFGFVAYRDHPPQCKSFVTKVKDLCSADEVLKFIKEIKAEEGGDIPEAVMDGLYDAIYKISWTDGWRIFGGSNKPVLKVIVHIGDAPPHGKEYGDGSYMWKDGCPCKITIGDIAKGLKKKNIQYKLIKIGNYVKEMARIFRDNIEKYDEVELKNAGELEIQVSNMISRELSSMEIDYKKIDKKETY